MNRWNLVIALALAGVGIVDLIRREWLSGGTYLSLGLSTLLGVDKPGPRKVLAILLGLTAVGLLVFKFTQQLRG